MIVTTLTLNCTYKHRISGRVYPLVLLEIASMISWPGGNVSVFTFIVLNSQSCIYFVPKCRIQLIRLVYLVFSSKWFCPSMASLQGGPFFPASTESRILSQLQCGGGHRSNYQIISILFFYCLLFPFVYNQKILYSFLRMCFLFF